MRRLIAFCSVVHCRCDAVRLGIIRFVAVSVLLCVSLSLYTFAHSAGVHSATVCSRVDEGMWTFDSPPLKVLFDRYGFTPSAQWLDTLRLSSVRFTTGGGSGAFVSANGLVITNHHVVMDQLQQLSTLERDIVANGFTARSQAQELRCPTIELDVLLGMDNITARMLMVQKKGMTDEAILKAQQAERTRIEREATDNRTGHHSELVTLYAGGEYWLYRYKRYTDVRLVVAPELQAANFGGDYDNFTYPRYALDFALLRVYEFGKPLETTHFLKWKTQGVASNQELTFVSGNPGATNRFNTYAQFIFNRDVYYPFMIRRVDSFLSAVRQYSERGVHESRRALDDMLNYENIKKSLVGEYEGLRNRAIETRCKTNEDDLRLKVATDPELTRQYGNAWDIIERITQKQAVVFKEYISTFSTPLAEVAFTLIRYTFEAEKIAEKIAERTATKPVSGMRPDEKAVQLQATENLADLKMQVLNVSAINLDYEETKLAGELHFLLSELSAGDPFVNIMLGDGSGSGSGDGSGGGNRNSNGNILRTPPDVAREAVRGTRLNDVSFRRALLEGGRKAIERSNDPMIVFMRRLVPLWLEREDYQRTNTQAPLTSALEKISLARFAIYGKQAYPDATFTLRLGFGTVKSYSMNGTLAPLRTTLYGIFDRAAGFEPSELKQDFSVPARFLQNRDKITLSTPANFITTCDIVGGNSGSPLVNRNLEFVGLVFDGNIESLAGRFAFNEEASRTLCVHPAFIIEALRKIYDANAVADELEGVGGRRKGKIKG
jgi:Peptidase S46